MIKMANFMLDTFTTVKNENKKKKQLQLWWLILILFLTTEVIRLLFTKK